MAADAEFSLSAIGQIAVPVRDIEGATAFYRDTLGLRHLFSAPPGMAFFDCDGVRLMLSVPERGETKGEAPPSKHVLYFRTDAIDRAAAALSSRGARFSGAPRVIHRTDAYELWMAFFHDPDGNVLALMEERATA